MFVYTQNVCVYSATPVPPPARRKPEEKCRPSPVQEPPGGDGVTVASLACPKLPVVDVEGRYRQLPSLLYQVNSISCGL